MKTNIIYELNGGHWNPKDEMKVAFYTDLYDFVHQKHPEALSGIGVQEFTNLEPYLIGNMLGRFFLKEEVGGTLENQPDTHFIGYCHKRGKYAKLIPHLIHFFALWREIEQCRELNATDFFANSWASLVDTAKFFKYTTLEELQKSPEAPQVRDQRILYMIQHCPQLKDAPTEIEPKTTVKLPNPRKEHHEFLGWFESPMLDGAQVALLSHQGAESVVVHAKWGTHTTFHANDGYVRFEDLYEDFLKCFSDAIGEIVTTEKIRVEGHGWISDFCEKAKNGGLNAMFAHAKNRSKWMWLIDYLRSLYTNEEMKTKFDFKDRGFVDEDQVRWELNSLFVGRYHLVPPKTRDYSGAGIREKLVDSTNSKIEVVRYPVGENVSLPRFERKGFRFSGWYEDSFGTVGPVTAIIDNRYAGKTLFASWMKSSDSLF